ncbi:hypothetical protein Dsin_008822 [Dipteronia sinensis]|uniref:MULE transposase domain-containing protein n=1 Tax=Dipteronia sinensis TaxID=43782 RepID=A0AAE0EBI3_9ROSI|nr:hypothetical protein Dsin_008822 [Dipteronia sinensis]
MFTQRSATCNAGNPQGPEKLCTILLAVVDVAGRHVQGDRPRGSSLEVLGTSDVPENVNLSASDNSTTWVIPVSYSYLFGEVNNTMGSREPNTMIYKGQYFLRKKDLKRAVRRNEGTYFQDRNFVSEHICPLEEVNRHHRQASAIIIGEVVAHRLQQHYGILMRPKNIIADMKTMYGIQITYTKAHQGLYYALALTYGSHEETFKLLPSFGHVLEQQQNPGTITKLQCIDDNKFLYFFMALEPSIRGFRRCIHHVIHVDGTDLKGRCTSTMFVAITQDGSEQVYLLAFG